MWGREQEVSQMRFGVSLILALGLASAALLVPLLALAEVDPAARHKQLAAVIENEIKLRKDSSARYQPYVHWVRLDRDQYVDARSVDLHDANVRSGAQQPKRNNPDCDQPGCAGHLHHHVDA